MAETISTGSRVKFSCLKPEDTDQVYELLNERAWEGGFHNPSYYTISSLIQLYGDISIAARENNTIMAACINCPFLYEKAIYVYIFAVSPSHQRKGIGTSLHNNMALMLKQKGYQKTTLRAMMTNQIALSFWTKLGFLIKEDIIPESNDIHSEYILERIL